MPRLYRAARKWIASFITAPEEVELPEACATNQATVRSDRSR
jgi:hypothetical protein